MKKKLKNNKSLWQAPGTKWDAGDQTGSVLFWLHARQTPTTVL